jgi:2',3'-cyclic-nucleotide 2'-phosphodiesterase/3'-nucleotidase
MMSTRRRWSRWLCGLAAAVLLAGSATAQQLRLRILETTDLHMNLLGYDYYQDKPTEEYGLERTATLIKAARAEAKNSLLFDNGDLLQGSPLGDYVARIRPLAPGQLHPAFKVMNALGYDAANVGNHEFNYGLPFLQPGPDGRGVPLRQRQRGQGRSRLAARLPALRHARTPLHDEAGASHTLKIGVTGFVPPQIMQWDQQHLTGRVKARDIPQTARELVPQMKAAGADVVVLIPTRASSAAKPSSLPRTPWPAWPKCRA